LPGAKRDPDSDLVRPLAEGVRDHSINSSRGECQRQASNEAQKLISTGVVEGLNNKSKVTMRKSYAFRTYRVVELALYHSPGKLPESESTHGF